MLRSCSDINKLLKNAHFDWLKKTLDKAWAKSRSRLPSPPLSYQLCLDIMFIEAHGSHRSEKHLLLSSSIYETFHIYHFAIRGATNDLWINDVIY